MRDGQIVNEVRQQVDCSKTRADIDRRAEADGAKADAADDDRDGHVDILGRKVATHPTYASYTHRTPPLRTSSPRKSTLLRSFVLFSSATYPTR